MNSHHNVLPSLRIVRFLRLRLLLFPPLPMRRHCSPEGLAAGGGGSGFSAASSQRRPLQTATPHGGEGAAGSMAAARPPRQGGLLAQAAGPGPGPAQARLGAGAAGRAAPGRGKAWAGRVVLQRLVIRGFTFAAACFVS